jgi:hypothetical protein
MAIIKKQTSTNAGEDAGKNRTLKHCGWECKLLQPLWTSVWKFIKNLQPAGHQWFMPVILATQEAEIGIVVQSQSGHTIQKSLSQKKKSQKK